MTRTLGLLTLCSVLILGVTGCNYVDNRKVFPSTYTQPMTAYIISQPSGETVWTYPIPPNHKLVVDLDTENAGSEMFYRTEGPATDLTYTLYEIDARPSIFLRNRFYGTVVDSGTQQLYGTPVLGSTVGQPIDPSDIPSDRTIEEIEADIQTDGDLPEPTTPAEDEGDSEGE